MVIGHSLRVYKGGVIHGTRRHLWLEDAVPGSAPSDTGVVEYPGRGAANVPNLSEETGPELFILMENTKVCWFVDGLVMVDGDVIFFHEFLKICFSKNVNCCESGSQEMDGLQMMSIRRSAP